MKSEVQKKAREQDVQKKAREQDVPLFMNTKVTTLKCKFTRVLSSLLPRCL